jgi:exopolyphosphatase/guanosine-5'-triphosphate,3'-diphosphate pyrophosphatase
MVRRRDVRDWVRRLGHMDVDERASLHGVAQSRAPQVLAGAIVANEAMRALNVSELAVCPWGLREGVLLRRLDRLDANDGSHAPQPV